MEKESKKAYLEPRVKVVPFVVERGYQATGVRDNGMNYDTEYGGNIYDGNTPGDDNDFWHRY